MTHKIIEAIRHWWLLDLKVIRSHLTPEMISRAKTIDNQDGTQGKAFKVAWFPNAAIIDCSETMRVAAAHGVNAIQPWETGKPRRTRPPPDLQALVARYGRYDLIPPDAWKQWDADMARYVSAMRAGKIEIKEE